MLETTVLSDATFQFGEELTTALLGLDALYADEQGKGERGSGGDIERLVVLNMSKSHRPEPFESYAAAIARFTEFAARAVSLPEPDRRLYYRQTCQSSIAFAEWRSNGLAFPDQITRFLHVPSRPATNAELDELRQGMRTILTELGYTGDLPAQCAAWEARQRVDPDSVQQVLDDLFSEAWDLTADFMEIPASKSDGMRVETVRATPYNAMCDYSQRLIRLKTSTRCSRSSVFAISRFTSAIPATMCNSAGGSSATSKAWRRRTVCCPWSTRPARRRSRGSPISECRSSDGIERRTTSRRRLIHSSSSCSVVKPTHTSSHHPVVR
jgi:hypothetical protein